MIVVAALTFLWLRPADIRRMSWAIVPGLLAIHVALPGTLGALKQSFMPSGGLIAQQQYGAGQSSHARLAAFGPAITMWQKEPLFGRGYGAPVSIWGSENLDDQWLGTLLTTGIVGFVGWLWFVCRAVRRLGREAKRDTTERGWLLAALTASVAGFAAGMLTFDAFAFIQVTLLLFISLALGSALLADRAPVTETPDHRQSAAPQPARAN
jgi:O-antigen ligase